MAIVTMTGCAVHFQRTEPDGVNFYLRAPEAQSVQIAASYNGFSVQPTRRYNATTWVAKLPKGISFSYFYLVDGKTYIPPCKMMEQDDFGQANCIFSPTL
jgi:1,4-alpha-glucan branching enzyme